MSNLSTYTINQTSIACLHNVMAPCHVIASRYTGVVHAFSSSSISASNSSFYSNEAGVDGGVMYANHSDHITLGNSIFENIEANCGGVAYISFRCRITVINSYFFGIGASSDRGAMNASTSGQITVNNRFTIGTIEL